MNVVKKIDLPDGEAVPLSSCKIEDVVGMIVYSVRGTIGLVTHVCRNPKEIIYLLQTEVVVIQWQNGKKSKLALKDYIHVLWDGERIY
jgi:hypothetical protein